MRTVAIVLALSAGCSAIFMERVPDRYDPHNPQTPPECTATKGFALWDGALALGSVAILIALNSNTSMSSISTSGADNARIALSAAVVVLGAAHFISAIRGSGWADQCIDARANHDKIAISPPPQPTPATPAGPRGFYCTTSTADPIVGFCSHSRTACDQAKQLIASSSGCLLTDSAFCFDGADNNPACAPTLEGCQRQTTAICSQRP